MKDPVLNQKVSAMLHRSKKYIHTPQQPKEQIDTTEYYVENNQLFNPKSSYLKTLLEEINK